mgnify:CR=1 FL=1
MCAKPSRKTPRPAVAAPAAAAPVRVAEETTAGSWLDSSDPRRRTWARVLFAGIWIYVGALWLLALDQTFRWGIFD